MATGFLPAFEHTVRRLLLAAIASTSLAAVRFGTGVWSAHYQARAADEFLAVDCVLFATILLFEVWAYRVFKAGVPRLMEISAAFGQAHDERQEVSALLQTVVATTPGVIYAKDREGRLLLANAAALALIGKPWDQVKGRTDREFLDDRSQGEAIMATDRRIMDTGQALELEEPVGHQVWLSTKTPLRNAAGGVTGLVGVSVEITDRKRSEERLRLMVNELNHRVKNTLTTVQSIALFTLRGGDPAVRRSLEQRLMALASAHDVLTQENWEGAMLIDIVTRVLAPHDGPHGVRFRVGGPPLRLVPRAALALAMGLHELTTNALKHGALSVESGQIEIYWEVSSVEKPEFQLKWSERNGPPVGKPTGRGFGTLLMERSVAQDLGGTVDLQFAAAGVTCEVRAPLREVVASAERTALLHIGSG